MTDFEHVSLVLVRHGRPEVRSDAPAPAWLLSAEGRAAAAALSRRLAGLRIAAALSSPEPKAYETTRILADALGVPVETDPGLGEHRRDAWGFAPEEVARARVRAVLAEPEAVIEGAETGQAARARFEAALARRPERPLLVGSHGTILSLWLAPRLGLDAVALWASLGLAEAILLDASGKLVARVKGEGAA